MAPVTRPEPPRPAAAPDKKPAKTVSAEDAAPVQDSAAKAIDSASKTKEAYAKAVSAKDGAAQPRDADRPPGSAVYEKASRWALLLLAVAFGAAVGTLGSFGHRESATWLGVSWPTGLVLGFCGLIGLLLGLGELLGAGVPASWRPSRLSALGWASTGWLLALLWLTYLGPPPSLARKGDVVLANDWKSLAYLLGGMAVVTAAVYRAWVAALSARLAGRTGAPGGVHPKG
jgi:hypothetical protein